MKSYAGGLRNNLGEGLGEGFSREERLTGAKQKELLNEGTLTNTMNWVGTFFPNTHLLRRLLSPKATKPL